MSPYKETDVVTRDKNVDRHIHVNSLYLDHYTAASFKHT
jgi:hypothetical protein